MTNMLKQIKNDSLSHGKVTLKSIAEQCGVKVATVSRVLNNKDGFSIRPKKRELIIKTAMQTGYMPNVAARNLRMKKTNQIMIHGFNVTFGSAQTTNTEMLNVCIRRLNEAGYQVNMVFPSNQKQLVAPMASDGALIIGVLDPALLQEFDKFNVKFVILNDKFENASWVSIDDYSGMALALEHLYELGHRRIAYRCAHYQHRLLIKHHSIRDRHNSYVNWMKERGLEAFTDYGDKMDEETFFNETEKRKISAIVAYDYLNAIALNVHCQKSGVRIPDDLSMVAFNRLIEKLQGYNLTSVYKPLEEMGNFAADTLLNKIDGKLKNEQRVFAPYLHIGDSTGPAPDNIKTSIKHIQNISI